MTYQEEDFANMLFAWPVVEGSIVHLYEIDPTHVTAQPTGVRASDAHRTKHVSRSTLPFCMLTDTPPAVVLLELDPTHAHAC